MNGGNCPVSISGIINGNNLRQTDCHNETIVEAILFLAQNFIQIQINGLWVRHFFAENFGTEEIRTAIYTR